MSGNGTYVEEIRDENDVVTGYIAGLGGSMTDGVWVSADTPDAPVVALKQFLVAYAQQIRQEVEDLGVLVDGNVFSTDISSQVKYVGIMVYAALNRDYVGSWKTANNTFVTLDAAGVSVLCACVMAYLQVCFGWEQYIGYQVLTATTVEQLQAIDLVTGRPDGTLPSYVMAAIEASGGAFGSGTLQGTALAVSGTATAARFKGGSAMPAIATGPGAGTNATVGLTSGSNDAGGQVSIVTDATVSSDTGDVIVTVTFDAAYDTAPFVVVSPANAAAGAVAQAPYVTATDTGFTLSISNGAALSASTTYLFNYVALQ